MARVGDCQRLHHSRTEKTRPGFHRAALEVTCSTGRSSPSGLAGCSTGSCSRCRSHHCRTCSSCTSSWCRSSTRRSGSRPGPGRAGSGQRSKRREAKLACGVPFVAARGGDQFIGGPARTVRAIAAESIREHERSRSSRGSAARTPADHRSAADGNPRSG